MASGRLTIRIMEALGASEHGVYAGPRPYRTGQRMHGRDRETADVLSLLISQRLLLLHSPSGAGKTSLILANIVPAMQRRRFEVPMQAGSDDGGSQPTVIRLNRGLEPGDPPGVNRYVLCALLSLESHRPAHQRRTIRQLAQLDLDTYLEQAFPAASRDFAEAPDQSDSFRPLLLLLDQFEELISLDPSDRPAKLEFIQQLAVALSNPGRWALFAIREDFLGALEPYIEYLPTRLGARYRLDLLTVDVAPTVIEEPARAAGVAFEPGVVERIVADLSRARVQAEDGSFRFVDGRYVEPVHLQVICQSLWRIKGDATTITEAHLRELGGRQGRGLDDVLGNYYAACVALAARDAAIDERNLRDWFERHLIGDQRVRRPILLNEALDFGLTMVALRILDKAFLVRRENRGGAIWYELAHDRLVGPVLDNNQAWREEHLSWFQRQVEVWVQRGRPDDLLLTGPTLTKCPEAAAGGERLTASEREFLDASRHKQQDQQRADEYAAQRRRVQTMQYALLLGATVLTLLIALCALTIRYAYLAKAAEDLARWHAYAGELGDVQRNLASRDFRGAQRTLDSLRQNTSYTKLLGWEYDYLYRQNEQVEGTYLGHDASVLALAVSHDGQWFASTGSDRTIQLWDVRQKAPLFSRQEYLESADANGHQGWVNCLAISHDDQWVISASDDGSVRRWAVTGTVADGSLGLNSSPVMLDNVHTDAVTCLAISPHDDWFVSGSEDGTLIMWNASDNGKRGELENDVRTGVTAVAISPNAKTVLCGCQNGQVLLWDIDSGRLLHILDEHDGPVTSVAFHPGGLDGSQGLSSSQDGTIREWDLVAGAQVNRPLRAFEDGVRCAVYGNRGDLILCGSSNGEVKEYARRAVDGEVHWWEEVFWAQAHHAVVYCVAYVLERPGQRDPDQRRRFLTGSADCSVRIWNTHPSAPPKGHRDAIWDVAVARNGRFYTASEDETIRIWDLNSGQSVGEIKGHQDAVWCVAVNDRGDRIASGGDDRTVRVWNSSDGRAVWPSASNDSSRPRKSGEPQLNGPHGHSDTVTDVAFSLDGKWLFSVSQDATLKVWNAVTGELRRTVAGDLPRTCVETSQDGQWLAAGTQANAVHVWSIDKLTAPSAESTATDPDIVLAVVPKLANTSNSVESVAFSPDSRHLATGGEDRTVRIWDLRARKLLAELKGHTAWVTCVTYSPDGERIASCGQDNTVKIWTSQGDVDVPLLTLSGHFESVWAMGFSRDGSTLVTASEDWTCRIWTADVGARRK